LSFPFQFRSKLKNEIRDVIKGIVEIKRSVLNKELKNQNLERWKNAKENNDEHLQ